MTDLRAEAMVELDRLDGTLQPEFVDAPDGRYIERVVFDELPAARFMKAGDSLPDAQPLAWHLEPCDIPRYRKELRWR